MHFACHGDLDTDSLVLVIPESDHPDAVRAKNEANKRTVLMRPWQISWTASKTFCMYRHLVDGLTVPQALRLAMLRLAHSDEPSCADGLRAEWKRPMDWAGFLVMAPARASLWIRWPTKVPLNNQDSAR